MFLEGHVLIEVVVQLLWLNPEAGRHLRSLPVVERSAKEQFTWSAACSVLEFAYSDPIEQLEATDATHQLLISFVSSILC